MTEKTKSHVSYPKELREEARMRGDGLVTIGVTMPDGERTEIQLVADSEACRFALWAGVLMARPDVRPLPRLDELAREVCEKNGIKA